MSKAVMISIRPEWCEKIGSGEKTIEVRKTRPRLELPFKCYIYCTNGRFPHEGFLCFDAGTNRVRAFYGGGKVIGEFVCDAVYSINAEHVAALKDAFIGISCDDFLRKSCLSAYDLLDYLTAPERQISIEYRPGYGWHISDLVIYDEPKLISEFWSRKDCGAWHEFYNLRRPPQSWCYVVEQKEGTL